METLTDLVKEAEDTGSILRFKRYPNGQINIVFIQTAMTFHCDSDESEDVVRRFKVDD